MNLVQPYLEALGVADMADLPMGTGIPPGDDPQINLGTIHLQTHKNLKKHPSNSAYCTPADNTNLPLPDRHLLSTSGYYPNLLASMPYRPKNHFEKHPLLTVKPMG